jgi:membrane dipeptidase
MRTLAYVDHRAAPDAWAAALGISRAAVDLYLASEVIDLHVDSYIWHRTFGYSLFDRHDHGWFDARFYSQADFPRMREAQLGGACWVITTNPARSASERAAVFRENLRELRGLFGEVDHEFALVSTTADYHAARALGKQAVWIGIQGGNALDLSLDALDAIDAKSILRVTLVHMSYTRIGGSSAPFAFSPHGLSDFGREYVRALERKRIFVDLAHISRRAFFDAVEAHDRSLPLIVTHTGVSGVTPHWRNLDDEQIRAIADTGGVIGIMYQASFLGDRPSEGKAASIVRHLQHIIDTVGEDHVALGSDWDGAITTPRDMKTCLELPVLVQRMLDAGFSEVRIAKVLGANFLRSLTHMRG